MPRAKKTAPTTDTIPDPQPAQVDPADDAASTDSLEAARECIAAMQRDMLSRELSAQGLPPDSLNRLKEASETAQHICRLDLQIESVKNQQKFLKDTRDQLVDKLVAITGNARQTTIFDAQAQSVSVGVDDLECHSHKSDPAHNPLRECAVCGAHDCTPTEQCKNCGLAKCESCDSGAGCWCAKCETDDLDDE
ncbi:MAG: hypothetical protein FJ026_10160 [Chloroflexi bacterium]|nr:hypothetical protein [Chloroflexota bacterium]